jgi:hypothetical protein
MRRIFDTQFQASRAFFPYVTFIVGISVRNAEFCRCDERGNHLNFTSPCGPQWQAPDSHTHLQNIFTTFTVVQRESKAMGGGAWPAGLSLPVSKIVSVFFFPSFFLFFWSCVVRHPAHAGPAGTALCPAAFSSLGWHFSSPGITSSA